MNSETLQNATQNGTTPSSSSGNGGMKYFIYVFYSFVFIPGFFGNILIIVSIIKFKKLQTAFNTFLANLAIADLLFILLSLFNIIKFILNSEWIFGEFVCKLQAVLIETSFTCSVCTLAAVAIERYISICLPQKFRRTIKRSIIVCTVLWFVSVIACSALGYGSKVSLNDKGEIGCHNNRWTDQERLIFYIVHTVLLYCVPLIVMCFCHIQIWKTLTERRKLKFSKVNHGYSSESSPDSQTSHARNGGHTDLSPDELNQKEDLKRLQIENERNAKIVRLLVIVILVYVVIWTPYVVMRLIIYTGNFINIIIIRGIQVLILSSTGVNFVIYSVVNPALRNAFKDMLCCCDKKDRSASYGSDRTSSSATQMTSSESKL